MNTVPCIDQELQAMQKIADRRTDKRPGWVYFNQTVVVGAGVKVEKCQSTQPVFGLFSNYLSANIYVARPILLAHNGANEAHNDKMKQKKN